MHFYSLTIMRPVSSTTALFAATVAWNLWFCCGLPTAATVSSNASSPLLYYAQPPIPTVINTQLSPRSRTTGRLVTIDQLQHFQPPTSPEAYRSILRALDDLLLITNIFSYPRSFQKPRIIIGPDYAVLDVGSPTVLMVVVTERNASSHTTSLCVATVERTEYDPTECVPMITSAAKLSAQLHMLAQLLEPKLSAPPTDPPILSTEPPAGLHHSSPHSTPLPNQPGIQKEPFTATFLDEKAPDDPLTQLNSSTTDAPERYVQPSATLRTQTLPTTPQPLTFINQHSTPEANQPYTQLATTILQQPKPSACLQTDAAPTPLHYYVDTVGRSFRIAPAALLQIDRKVDAPQPTAQTTAPKLKETTDSEVLLIPFLVRRPSRPPSVYRLRRFFHPTQ